MQTSRGLGATCKPSKTFSGGPARPRSARPQAEGDNTVVGQCKKLMADVVPGDAATPTVEATLQRLDADLNSFDKSAAI